MKTKKSQIKMFETIAILIVFFFMVAFGLVFYSQIQGRSIKSEFQERYELRSINTVQLANYLPEIQCSAENIVTDNCYDIMKLKHFAEVSKDSKLYYYNLFYSSNITVSQIYPTEESWEIYSSVPDDWKEISKIQIPILLYDQIERRFNTGVVLVEVYR